MSFIDKENIDILQNGCDVEFLKIGAARYEINIAVEKGLALIEGVDCDLGNLLAWELSKEALWISWIQFHLKKLLISFGLDRRLDLSQPHHQKIIPLNQRLLSLLSQSHPKAMLFVVGLKTIRAV